MALPLPLASQLPPENSLPIFLFPALTQLNETSESEEQDMYIVQHYRRKIALGPDPSEVTRGKLRPALVAAVEPISSSLPPQP